MTLDDLRRVAETYLKDGEASIAASRNRESAATLDALIAGANLERLSPRTGACGSAGVGGASCSGISRLARWATGMLP